MGIWGPYRAKSKAMAMWRQAQIAHLKERHGLECWLRQTSSFAEIERVKEMDAVTEISDAYWRQQFLRRQAELQRSRDTDPR